MSSPALEFPPSQTHQTHNPEYQIKREFVELSSSDSDNDSDIERYEEQLENHPVDTHMVSNKPRHLCRNFPQKQPTAMLNDCEMIFDEVEPKVIRAIEPELQELHKKAPAFAKPMLTLALNSSEPLQFRDLETALRRLQTKGFPVPGVKNLNAEALWQYLEDWEQKQKN